MDCRPVQRKSRELVVREALFMAFKTTLSSAVRRLVRLGTYTAARPRSTTRFHRRLMHSSFIQGKLQKLSGSEPTTPLALFHRLVTPETSLQVPIISPLLPARRNFKPLPLDKRP